MMPLLFSVISSHALFCNLQDNHFLFDYNVHERVEDFINAALAQVTTRFFEFFLSVGAQYILLSIINFDSNDSGNSQANVTRDNHVMWTMGDDFQYQYAENWFREMDKLIHYVNKVIFKNEKLYEHTEEIEPLRYKFIYAALQDGRINALYSTPSIYTDAKNAGNVSWPLKADDYFP